MNVTARIDILTGRYHVQENVTQISCDGDFFHGTCNLAVFHQETGCPP
jgi:hypothetical protein